jgi:hypothetical protein
VEIQNGSFVAVARRAAFSECEAAGGSVQAAQLGVGQARADAPGVDKVSRIVVVGEQQGADVCP